MYEQLKNSSSHLSEKEIESRRSKSKETEFKTQDDKKQASESSYKTSSSSKYDKDDDEDIELKPIYTDANTETNLKNNESNNLTNNITNNAIEDQSLAKKNIIAKELLDKARRKRESKKLLNQIKEQKDGLNLDEEIKNSLKDEKSFDVSKIDETKLNDIKEMLAKIQKQRTPDRQQYEYDLNQDYLWYLQYYMNSYGLDTFSAAYYAQYAIVCCDDYKSKDISEWMQNQGYHYYLQQDIQRKVAEVNQI